MIVHMIFPVYIVFTGLDETFYCKHLEKTLA